MSDNTQQGGLDTIHTDEITLLNGVVVADGAKVQRIKAGYGADGILRDVTPNDGLPIGAAYLDVPLTAGTTTFTTAANGAAIDTLGFNWACIQMSAGYTGMTALTVQGSNDNVNWVTLAMSPIGSTSSGIATALGTAIAIWHGLIPTRYIRFVPVGTGSALTLTLTIRLLGEALVLNSQGVNAAAALNSIAASVAPAIADSALAIGTSSGNGFQVRATSTADQAATLLVPAVSGQFPYITGIHCSVQGSGATARRVQLVAAATALIEQNVVCPPNDSVSRMFRNPWKPSSASNVAVNLAVTGVVSATGVWDVVVEGYYQSS